MTDLLLPRELRLEWEKLPQFTLCANTGTQAVEGVCVDLLCESRGGDACLFQFVRWREAEALAAAALAAATAENEQQALEHALWLIDCEQDGVRDGNVFTPSQQAAAISVLANLRQRFDGASALASRVPQPDTMSSNESSK